MAKANKDFLIAWESKAGIGASPDGIIPAHRCLIRANGITLLAHHRIVFEDLSNGDLIVAAVSFCNIPTLRVVAIANDTRVLAYNYKSSASLESVWHFLWPIQQTVE